MRVMLALGTLLLTLSGYAHANTEKTIFLGPSSIHFPLPPSELQYLRLSTITPAQSSLRTRLPVSFPTEQAPQGNTSIYLLNDLTPGQRYELRVCWAATSPTDFTLTTYTIPKVFETPEYIQPLALYSEQRQDLPRPEFLSGTSEQAGAKSSTEQSNTGGITALFLYVHAAAAFYTTNQTLMQHPPPVLVDIILDPYVFNIFPRSLGPTAVYLSGLAVTGWYISGFIWNWLFSSLLQEFITRLHFRIWHVDRPLTMNDSSHASHQSGNRNLVRLRLYTLPRELIDYVLESLDAEALINLVFADYHAASCLGLAPPMTLATLLRLLCPPNASAFQSIVPNEILLIILSYMPPRSMINYMIANYHDFRRRNIAPALSPLTIWSMCHALCCRERN